MKSKSFVYVLFVILISQSFSQNITNTLGASGVFTIKNGPTNYFTLSQSTGQVNILRTLRLENTTDSTVGVLYMGSARFLHTYGYGNTFLGINSGNFTMTGFNNIVFGPYSFYSNTTGYQNSAFGIQSLYSNTTGYQNSVFGNWSLELNTTGNNNSAFGNWSLNRNTGGIENSAFGNFSLYSNTTGYQNSAFGYNSLYTNTTGYQNSAFGNLALLSNTTGWHNTAVGFDALRNNIGGYQNTAVGHHSLQNNTGNYNTAIGYNSGSTVTTGSNLTLIGIDANPTNPTATDQITLGNQFVNSLRCNVTTITSLSDRRDKKNIKELSVGLDFITKLKPRQFNWDRREWYEDGISDGSKIKHEPTAGFIAQELDSVQTQTGADWLNLVLKDNPEKWEATPGNLLPVMVKAIQELNEKCEGLKTENEKLKNDLEQLNDIKEKLTVLTGLINEIKQNNKEIKLTEK